MQALRCYMGCDRRCFLSRSNQFGFFPRSESRAAVYALSSEAQLGPYCGSGIDQVQATHEATAGAVGVQARR